ARALRQLRPAGDTLTLPLRELLDLLAGKRLQPRHERLDLPLRRVVRKDELLRARPIDDVGHPVVEVGRTPPRDGHAAHAHLPSTFNLREWLSAGVHRSSSPHVCGQSTARRRAASECVGTTDAGSTSARTSYERRHRSVKASFHRVRCVRPYRRGEGTAPIGNFFPTPFSVDEQTVTFLGSAREGPPYRAISDSVDTGGHVDNAVYCSGRSARPRGEDRVQDSTRQRRTARDEAREAAYRGRALTQEGHGLVGRVDPSRRDDLERIAEPGT